jgi:hypothetical protein
LEDQARTPPSSAVTPAPPVLFNCTMVLGPTSSCVMHGLTLYSLYRYFHGSVLWNSKHHAPCWQRRCFRLSDIRPPNRQSDVDTAGCRPKQLRDGRQANTTTRWFSTAKYKASSTHYEVRALWCGKISLLGNVLKASSHNRSCANGT